ncbi:MAG TPA: hypothetical protein DCY88_13005, partial [Cyanobacteria bacterium UBA11372]|nr:hypothetical protein [Cyanobacteria bacterium UBA11372]
RQQKWQPLLHSKPQGLYSTKSLSYYKPAPPDATDATGFDISYSGLQVDEGKRYRLVCQARCHFCCLHTAASRYNS